MDFYELQKSSILLENIAAAKALLLKDYAEKEGKTLNEIPEEIKKSVLRNPKYQQVLDLAKEGRYYENGETRQSDEPGGNEKLPKNEGWVYLLTKLYVIDGCPWEELVSVDHEGNPTGIYNMMVELKPNLGQLPLKNPDAYARIKDEDGRPAYEVLGDDLRSMQSKRKLKKLYDEFIGRMKAEFKKASESSDPSDKKLIEELELSALALEKLKPKKGIDEKTKQMVTLIPFEEWKKATGKKYSDTPENLEYYPQYENPKVAFKDLVKDTVNFVESWNLGGEGYYQKLLELGPKAGILYYKNGYLAMSARTPEAQRVVSGDTKFCINNDSTFWSYGEGSIQINIINDNLPKANKKYLLGVTVKKDGTVKNCAWKTNSGSDTDFHKSGMKYATFLKQLDYPQELIQTIVEKFDEEVSIKLTLETFYKDSKNLSPGQLVKSLIGIKSGIFSGIVSPDTWNQISGIVSFIIKDERGIPVSDFVKEFKDNGIYTEAAWEIFDYVVEGNYTKKDMEDILETTEEVYMEVENIAKSKNIDSILRTKEEKEGFYKVHDNMEKNLEKIKSLIASK